MTQDGERRVDGSEIKLGLQGKMRQLGFRFYLFQLGKATQEGGDNGDQKRQEGLIHVRLRIGTTTSLR